jgi:hypothetical protein
MNVKDYITIRLLFDANKNDEEAIVRELLNINKHLTLNEANKMLINYLQGINKKNETLVERFILNGVEYGLIPNLQQMYTVEYLEIDSYENKVESIHKLLAVLYRPIKYSYGKSYEIEKFVDVERYSSEMLEADISIYHSVMSFFLTLNVILLQNSHEYIQSQALKQKVKEE